MHFQGEIVYLFCLKRRRSEAKVLIYTIFFNVFSSFKKCELERVVLHVKWKNISFIKIYIFAFILGIYLITIELRIKFLTNKHLNIFYLFIIQNMHKNTGQHTILLFNMLVSKRFLLEDKWNQCILKMHQFWHMSFITILTRKFRKICLLKCYAVLVCQFWCIFKTKRRS